MSMRKKKRILPQLLTLLFVGGFAAAMYFYGQEILKVSIEVFDTSFCQCEIKINKLRWKLQKPLQFSLTELSVKGEGIDVEAKELRLVLKPELLSQQPYWKLIAEVDIHQAQGTFDEASESPTNTSLPGGEPTARDWNRRWSEYRHFAFSLKMSKSQLGLSTLEPSSGKSSRKSLDINKLSFDMVAAPKRLALSFDGQWKSDLKTDGGSHLIVAPINAVIEVLGSENGIEIKQGSVSVFGVPIKLAGSVALPSNALKFGVKIERFDLKALPAGVQLPGLSHPEGLVSIDGQFTRTGTLAPWEVKGTVSLQRIAGHAGWQDSHFKIQGPIKAELELALEYISDKPIKIPKLKWSLDASEANVHVPGLLNKVEGERFSSQGELRYHESLALDAVDIQLAQIQTSLSGQIEENRNASVDFHLKPFSLSGLEKLFPILREYPLSGIAELKGSLSGSLNKPEDAEVILEKLMLEKVKGNLDWRAGEWTLAGPFSGSANASLHAVGKLVKSGWLNCTIDLTAMKIEKGTFFKKNNQMPLQLNIAAKAGAGALVVDNGQLRGPFGILKIGGIIPVPPAYATNLFLSTEELNLAALRGMVPGASFIPDGLLKLRLQFPGEVNPSDLLHSVLRPKGEIKLLIPEVMIAGAEPPLGPKGEAKPLVPPEPLLPSLPLLQRMDIQTELRVMRVRWRKQEFGDVKISARLREGDAIGQSVVSKIFDGGLEFTSFEIPLFTIDPVIKFKIKAIRNNLGTVFDLFLPQWKGLATGLLSGQLSGTTKLPSSPSFIEDLVSSGQILVESGRLSSLPIKEYLEGKLSSIPGGQNLSKAVSFENLNLSMMANYKLEKSNLSFKPLIVTSREGHSLNLDGSLGFDKRIKFQGNLSLVGVHRSDSFIVANKDDKGHLVVPVFVDGEFGHPKFYIVDETLFQMTKKMIEFEKEKAKLNLEKKVETRVKGTLDELKSQVRSKFEGEVKELLNKK